MIPSIVAKQVHETILDYLRATFAFAEKDFDLALFEFLNGDRGCSKVRTLISACRKCCGMTNGSKARYRRDFTWLGKVASLRG